MKKLAYLFAAFILAGCGGSTQMVQNARIGGDANAKGYQEVMRIKADCSSCASGGQSLTINGASYTSDVAIKCCIAQSRIDTNAAIKKVYIHRILDERSPESGIKFVSKKGAKMLYSKERLEGLFYLFLQIYFLIPTKSLINQQLKGKGNLSLLPLPYSLYHRAAKVA